MSTSTMKRIGVRSSHVARIIWVHFIREKKGRITRLICDEALLTYAIHSDEVRADKAKRCRKVPCSIMTAVLDLD